jgi:hypothetical protein
VAKGLAVARELAPAGLRSGPKKSGSAAHSSGSKLPRHSKPPYHNKLPHHSKLPLHIISLPHKILTQP